MSMPSLKVKIGADTEGLDKGLAKASRNMRGLSRTAAKAFAAVGAAAGLANAGLIVFARHQANVIDQNTKLARSLGLTHNEFLAMSQVANEAGVATGQLSAMLGIMQRNIVELGKGTKTQEDAFARLGLAMGDLEGQSPAAQFEIIASRLNQIGDPATRTATAMDVLGKSGRGAINMLEGYADKIKDAAEFQEKFGLAVSQTDAEQIERANDALGRLLSIASGVGNQIAVYVAPAVEAMSNALIDLAAGVGPLRDALAPLLDNLDRLGIYTATAAAFFVGPWAFGLAVAAASTVTLSGALALLRVAMIRTGILAVIVGAGELVYQFTRLVKGAGGFGQALELLGDVGADVWDRMKTGGESLVLGMKSVGFSIQSNFLSMLANIQQKWADFLHITASTLSDAGMDETSAKIRGAAIDAGSGFYELSLAAQEASSGADTYAEKAEVMAKAATAALPSIAALRAAMANADTVGGPAVNPDTPGGPEGGQPVAPDETGLIMPGVAGAGKITEDMQIRLDALRESLMTEQEEVDAWYMRSLEALDWYDAQRTSRQATSAEDRLRLEQEYRDKVDALTVRGAEREKKSTQEAASAALSSLSTVFKKSKGIRVAMAIMDTYAGATRALKDYAAPYSYAVAASVVAAGLANVASIMSASSSGGGGGGGGAAAAGAAPTEAAPTTTFKFNISGDSGGFGESVMRQFVDQLNSTQRNGGRFVGVIA